ncbi:hypothetical protein BDC45DRAFT_537076 [Circinella umbellata]|nr:hypothetical protein BDC45DRAFT_537076 [Circinella umbellata]
MLDLCEGSEWSGCIAWQFQSAGSTGRLNSIHVVGNGLKIQFQESTFFKLRETLADLQINLNLGSPLGMLWWHIPSNLYGYVPTHFTEELLKELHLSSSPSTTTLTQSSSSFTIYESLVYDSNDWAFTGEKWYSSILDIELDGSP